MIQDVSHFIAKPHFKEHLSPKKREIIFRTLREYKHEIENGTFNKQISQPSQIVDPTPISSGRAKNATIFSKGFESVTD